MVSEVNKNTPIDSNILPVKGSDANSSAPQKLNTVMLDSEILEMLKKLGISLEEWNSFSPEQQAKKISEYKVLENEDIVPTGLKLEKSQTYEISAYEKEINERTGADGKWEKKVQGTTFSEALTKFYGKKYTEATPEKQRELEETYFNEYILKDAKVSGKKVNVNSQYRLYLDRADSYDEYVKVASMISRLEGRTDAETAKIQGNAYDDAVLKPEDITRQKAGYEGTTSVVGKLHESVQERIIDDADADFATTKARQNIVQNTPLLKDSNSAIMAIIETKDDEAISAFGDYNTINEIERLKGKESANDAFKIITDSRDIKNTTQEDIVEKTISKNENDLRKEELGNIAFKSENVHSIVGAQRAANTIKNEEVFERYDKNAMNAIDSLDSKEDRIYATEARMDTMSKALVERQKKMYANTMESKHDDVLETAASNIYKLDEAVRDYAESLTKSLGKENVTSSIQKTPPTEQNTSDNNAVQQRSYTETQGTQTSNNSKQLNQQYQAEQAAKKLDLSTIDGIQKFIKIAGRYPLQFGNYLAGLKGNELQDKVLTLCKYAPEKIIGLVKNNPSLGVFILNCSKVNLSIQNKVAKEILSSSTEGSAEWKLANSHLNRYDVSKKTNEKPKI